MGQMSGTESRIEEVDIEILEVPFSMLCRIAIENSTSILST